jgi:hypothetical protein
MPAGDRAVTGFEGDLAVERTRPLWQNQRPYCTPDLLVAGLKYFVFNQ